MKTEIPEGLRASLDATREASAIALLVRHADREKIPRGEHGVDAALLPVGQARATALNAALHLWTSRWAVSSPLPRCMDTAQYAGFEAEPCNIYGAPGPYVVCEEKGGRVFLAQGAESVVRQQLAGHSWPFMRSLEEGARIVVDDIRHRLHHHGGVGLLVSHDAVVMPIIKILTDESFTDDWLAPLDGLVFALSPDAAMGVYWAGRRYKVAL